MAHFIPRSPGPQVQQQLGPQIRNTQQIDLSPAARAAGIAGQAATQFFEREVERADTARLMDARTQLSTWLTGIRDPNNADGIAKYRGEAAMGMSEALTSQLDSRISEIAGGLTRSQREQFDGIAANFRNTAREQWATYADGQVRAAIAAKGEAMNLALVDEAVQFGMSGDFAGQLGTLQELAAANERRDQLDGVAQEVTQQNNRTRQSEVYRKTTEGILIADPYAAKRYLDGVRDQMTSPDLIAASRSVESKVQALELKAERDRDRAEARAETAARKREAAAARALDRFERQIASTVPPPVETLTEWSQMVAGGTAEQQAEWKQLLASEVEVRRVLALRPIEQRTALEAARASQRTQGATVQQQANLKRLESAIETNLTDLREQPLVAYSRQTGEGFEPLNIQALMSGDPSSLRRPLASRMDTLRAMREQYGAEVGRAPLLPQEAAALSSALQQAAPQRAAEMFGALAGAFDDPGAYRAAMQQIAPDSPVRAYAGMIFAEQRSTTIDRGGIFRGAVKSEAGDVARTMLEGEALLNKARGDREQDGKGGAFPMPPPSQLTAELESFVGNAFAGSPGAYEVASQSVRAYYAGASARAGDVTGEVDRRRVREAVRAVLGEPVDINGQDVFPPWGMDESTFEDTLESTWGQALQQIPDGFSRSLDDYTLRQVGGNTYRVVGAGGAYLPGKDGDPLTLVITR